MDDLMGMMQELLSDPESMKQIQELTQMLQSESGGSEDSAQSAQSAFQMLPSAMTSVYTWFSFR